jgi:hypothetical protein
LNFKIKTTIDCKALPTKVEKIKQNSLNFPFKTVNSDLNTLDKETDISKICDGKEKNTMAAFYTPVRPIRVF